MNLYSKQKARMIINMVLTVFTLLALIVSMAAWFSTRKYVEISSINLQVNRKEIVIQGPKSFVFPCATKLSDVDDETFNNHCVLEANYIVEGAGELFVEIENKQDILGLVWDYNDSENYVYHKDTGTPDYYTSLMNVLKKHYNTNVLTSEHFEYESLCNALRSINQRPVGRSVLDGNGNTNTEIRIVYWADYTQLSSELNKVSNGVYAFSQKLFTVDLTFIA